jgi:hypothetical protein
LYGTDPLTWLDSEHLGSGRHYRLTEEDVGKVVHCQVSATREGATAFATVTVGDIDPEKPGKGKRPFRAG